MPVGLLYKCAVVVLCLSECSVNDFCIATNSPAITHHCIVLAYVFQEISAANTIFAFENIDSVAVRVEPH